MRLPCFAYACCLRLCIWGSFDATRNGTRTGKSQWTSGLSFHKVVVYTPSLSESQLLKQSHSGLTTFQKVVIYNPTLSEPRLSKNSHSGPVFSKHFGATGNPPLECPVSASDDRKVGQVEHGPGSGPVVS